jgi:hypothetical protein
VDGWMGGWVGDTEHSIYLAAFYIEWLLFN